MRIIVMPNVVIPAKAGIHPIGHQLDPRLRGDDDGRYTA